MTTSLKTLALAFFAVLTLCAQAQIVKDAPLVSIASQDAYFKNLSALCGKAFAGKISVDTPASEGFNGPLIMHVRKCTDNQLQIPFHVGDDHSRTWIITKTGSGLSLKHDHRQKNGDYDKSTMYGGHTVDGGWANVQSFPADQYSKELFARLGNPQSNSNIWQMYIYPHTFSYRMIREGREFRVDFDLTKPVTLPPVPWGYQD